MPSNKISCFGKYKGLTTIILAAGIGKRMYSKKPKVLHTVLGRPLIRFVVDIARKIGSKEIIIVVGKHRKTIRKTIGNTVNYALQSIPRGTGDAARIGIKKAHHPSILILYGDVPLLTAHTLNGMLKHHCAQRAVLTVLTCRVKNPSGYGRILRSHRNNFVNGIVEDRDATRSQLKIKEINTGIYLGRRNELYKALCSLKNQNKQKEYYFTDTVKIFRRDNKKVVAYQITNEDEILGVNSRNDLARIRSIAKMQRDQRN